METGDFVRIKKKYFTDHMHFTEILQNKTEDRIYLGIVITLNNNLKLFVPFRSQRPKNDRVVKFGTYPIPSQTRKDACLDFTKTLIIMDNEYFEIIETTQVKIPKAQKREIEKNISKIRAMLKRYLVGYIKYTKNVQRYKKNKIDPLYKFSTFKNYHGILEIRDEYVTYEVQIKDALKQEGIHVPLTFFETVGSTNDVAKELVKNTPVHGGIVVAEVQSGGRGTYGRKFSSMTGGVYLSVMIDTSLWHFKQLELATLYVAVVAKKAIFDVLGITVDLKWVNDLFLNGKKVGGILTEKQFDSNWLVIGIGLNVATRVEDFSEELQNIVTTLGVDDGGHQVKSELIARLLYLLLEPSELSDAKIVLNLYKSGLFILGKSVEVTRGTDVFEGIVTDIDESGQLLITHNSETIALSAGTVKLKI